MQGVYSLPPVTCAAVVHSTDWYLGTIQLWVSTLGVSLQMPDRQNVPQRQTFTKPNITSMVRRESSRLASFVCLGVWCNKRTQRKCGGIEGSADSNRWGVKKLAPFDSAATADLHTSGSMLYALRPRLGAHGHALLYRPTGIGSGCARRGRRRLSTTSEPSKPAGSPNADDDPGWPLKVCATAGDYCSSVVKRGSITGTGRPTKC